MRQPAQSDAGGVQQTGEKAKEQASATAGQARQAVGDVAGTATEQARTVVEDARQQADTAVRDLRGRVTQEAESQSHRAAGAVRQWADELADMAEKTSGDSPVHGVVSQVADKGHRAADYLEENGLNGLTEDLKGFARRRPGAFLAGAALAGLLAGRMSKAGSKARQSAQQPPPRQEAVWEADQPVLPEEAAPDSPDVVVRRSAAGPTEV